MATLSGPNFKIDRAQVHLCALDAAIRAHDKAKSITAYDDLQTGEYVLEIKVPDPNVSLLGPIAGDFIGNLRSALDHLAWQLATIKHGVNAPKVFFPILGCDTEEPDRPNKIADATKGIPGDAVAVMESFQPYHAGNLYKSTHLWRLNKLWHIDKHRHIVLAQTMLDVFFPRVPSHIKPTSKKILDDGGIVRFPLSCKPQLNFEPRITPKVFFGAENEGISVDIEGFFDMYHFVRDKVVPPFQRFFPHPEKVR